MAKKIVKPTGVSIRAFVDDDRNYDMLVKETIHEQDRYTQLSIENDRNNQKLLMQAIVEAEKDGTELTTQQVDSILYAQSETLIKTLEGLQRSISIRDAIKNEKKYLQDKGKQSLAQQTKRASHKRPIKNEAGETLDNVIRTLAKNHPNEKPSELWPHLKSAIEEWSDSECTETRTGARDSWRYQFQQYSKADSITFGIFRKKLRQ